jgi:hypothetical protein
MAENKQNGAAPPEEGPRSFSVFLQNIADGEAERELARQLQELNLYLISEMKNRGDKVSGSLNLKVKLTVDTGKHCIVTYGVAQTRPNRKTTGAIFWLTEGGNMSVSDPRQPSLPGIRSVPPPEKPRELPVQPDGKSLAAGAAREEQ